MIPLCYNCHLGTGPEMVNGDINHWGCFEEWPITLKAKFIPYGEQYYELYLKETSG